MTGEFQKLPTTETDIGSVLRFDVREDKRLSNLQDNTSVDFHPLPPRLRQRAKGNRGTEKERWAGLTLAAVQFIGTTISLSGATKLVGEANLIRDLGISHNAVEADVFGFVNLGYEQLVFGYTLTGCENVVAFCIGAFFFDSLRLCKFIHCSRTFLKSIRRMGGGAEDADAARRWVASWPEGNLLPHGIRQLAFGMGDLVFMLGLWISREFLFENDASDNDQLPQCFDPVTVANDYMHTDLHPSRNGDRQWAGFEKFYQVRRTREAPFYFLLIGALMRVVGVAVNAAAFEGLNCLYLFPFGRCGKELDGSNAKHAKSFTRSDNDPTNLGARFSVMEKAIEDVSDTEASYEKLRPSAMAFVEAKRALIENNDIFSSVPQNGGLFKNGLNEWQSTVLEATSKTLTFYQQNKTLNRPQLLNSMKEDMNEFQKMLPQHILIPMFYAGPKVLSRGVVDPERCVCSCKLSCNRWFASLWHNHLGAMRMWTYFSAILLVFWVFAESRSGLYGGFTSSERGLYTWPVYVPPGASTLNASLSLHEPDVNSSSSLSFEGVIFPPERCLRSKDGQALPYPPGITRENDASSQMLHAANLLAFAETFRMIGAFAYLAGVVRGEASIPSSHTRLERGFSLRRLFP